MLNLIKMDLYRLIRSRYLWLTAIAYILMMLLMTSGVCNQRKQYLSDKEHYLTYNYNRQTDTYEEILAKDSGNPIYDEHIKMDGLAIYADNLYQAATIIFIIIFVILYTSSEMNSGFFKNIGGIKNVRNIRVFSTWVSILLGCALILFAGGMGVFGYILMQFKEVGVGTFGIPTSQLIHYIVTWLVSSVGLCLVIYLLTLVIDNPVVCMALGILIGIRVCGQLTSAIEYVLNLKEGSFTNLLLSEQLMHLPVEYGIEYSKILITTVCYVAAALIAGTICLRNKDIR